MANDPIDKVDLQVSLNGRPLVEVASRITIAESIHSTFPTTSVEIPHDNYEMQEALAGQKLNVSVRGSSGAALTVDHVIHSAKPGFKESGKSLSGVISGVSPDYPNAVKERVTKGWSKKNTDDIIKEVHKEGLKSKYPIEVSSGFKQASMTSPSLLPLKAIEKAHGLSGAGSKAFYYQTNQDGGKAHAKTLKDLTKQGPKKTFTYKTNAAADPNSIYDGSTVYDAHYEGSPVSAQKQTQAQGMNYNPSHGKVNKNEKAGQGLSSAGLGVQSGQANTAYPVINTVEQDKEKRQYDRDQQSLNDYTAKLKLLVPIQTDLHAGDVISFNSGSATMFSDASPDNAASGKWLVASVIHTVETGGKDGTPHHTGRTLIHCIGKIS